MLITSSLHANASLKEEQRTKRESKHKSTCTIMPFGFIHKRSFIPCFLLWNVALTGWLPLHLQYSKFQRLQLHIPMRAAGMLHPPLLTNNKNEFYQFKDFSLNMHSKETISKSEFSLVSITVYTGGLGWRGSATRLWNFWGISASIIINSWAFWYSLMSASLPQWLHQRPQGLISQQVVSF